MMDAVTLADAIRAPQVSCVEVMTAYLDYIAMDERGTAHHHERLRPAGRLNDCRGYLANGDI